MAGLARKLFVNWHTRRRQRSDISASLDSVAVMGFMKYEQIPFEVVIVEPNPAGGQNSFNRVDITALALRMAINDTTDDATPLAEQTAWTKDTSKSTFSATLNLNTAGMTGYITGDKTAIFELEIADTLNRVKILSEICNLSIGVEAVTTVSPDPTQVYLTLDMAKGLFVPRRMGSGETIILVSPDGHTELTIGVNDDGTIQNDLTSV